MIKNRDFEGIDYNRDAGEGVRIADLREKNQMSAKMFVPKKDEYEKLEDGRQIQIAVKGVPMTQAEAIELGLLENESNEVVQTDAPVKAKTPAENKAKTPDKNK